MKYAKALFFLLSALLFSSEKTLLFLPGGNTPFRLNSPTGILSLEEQGIPGHSVLKLETAGDGNAVQATALDLPPYSLKDRHLLLWVKLQNRENLREFWIYAAGGNDFADRIVFMPSDDKSQLTGNEWVCLRLPLSAGKTWGDPDPADLRAFQFWLSDGGAGRVSVEIGPVYLEETERESALVVSFDDGWKSQIDKAAPIMAQQGLKGTAYIIPALIGTEGYMTEQDLSRLAGEYGWSLGGHYAGRMDSLTGEEKRAALEGLSRWFGDRYLRAPDFSYPNGAFGGGLKEAIRPYFRSGRSIIEYAEALPPADPYLIKVMNIVPPVNPEALRARLGGMEEKGELLVLVFHRIEDDPVYETEISTGDFAEICALLGQSDVPVRTMAEVSAAFPEETYPLPVWPEEGGAVPVSSGETAGEAGGSDLIGEDLFHRDNPDGSGTLLPTQIDFSLDWKMVWGLGENPRYYSQLDEVSLYLQNELSESARLYTSFGVRDSNFADLSGGQIDGTLFSLNSLYLEQALPRDLTLTAGYLSPDPYHKWLQLTRSVKLESPFGQDITPDYLWLGLSCSGAGPLGMQAALVPDFAGKGIDGYGLPVLTYEEEDSPGDGYKLAVPNLFSSVWYDSDVIDGELAAALNGDALKIAAEGAAAFELDRITLLGSLGAKYTRGGDYATFPEWDHADNALRLSAGLTLYRSWGDVTFNPGTAYQAFIDERGDIRHIYGIDGGFFYKNMEFYTVWNFFDMETPLWGENVGFEAGMNLEYGDVTFAAGYTMGGFSAASGLYGNSDGNEGALDGPFLRIKATYW